MMGREKSVPEAVRQEATLWLVCSRFSSKLRGKRSKLTFLIVRRGVPAALAPVRAVAAGALLDRCVPCDTTAVPAVLAPATLGQAVIWYRCWRVGRATAGKTASAYATNRVKIT